MTMKSTSAVLFLVAATLASPSSASVEKRLLDVGQSPACFDSGSGFSEDVWSFCQSVAPGVFLYYTPTNDDGDALFGLRAPSHYDGWSALALAGNGGMKGASQIVVRQDENGEWLAEDRYSEDYLTPELDDSQDVKLLFARQNDERGTSWGVALRSNSCDERDYPIVDRSVWMHWALGSSHDFGFHGDKRGQFKANLMRAPGYSLSYATPIEPRSVGGMNEDDEVIETVDIRMPNIDVVLGEGGEDPTNPYICSFFDMEEVKKEHEIESGHHLDDSKVHITGFSPIIDPIAKKYVHHLLLYSCEAESAEEVGYAHNKVLPECGSMPTGCNEMKWAWAVGGVGTKLPPDVGIPLGGEGSSRWLVMQMHYYNPTLDEGIMDNSGVRVDFTTQLRKHDAGLMQLVSGVGSFHRDPMPFGQSTVSLSPSFVVPPSCTEEWDEPLSILGVMHHEHQAGKKMTIEVQRDSTNLGPMRLERRFDFNHHSSEESAIPQLLPGDEIVMNCEYDTSKRTEDVAFGEGTQDEMCYAAVLYYPLQTERDMMIYFPLDENTKTANEMACSNPGVGEDFKGVSMCTEYYMIDIPTFLQLDVGFNFGAPQLCNSPVYEMQFAHFFPGMCPPCSSNKSCTEEEVLAWGQDVVCPQRCGDFGGLTVWPNTDVTEASVTHSAFCGSGMKFFHHTYIKPDQCEVRGDLSVEHLELDEEEEIPSGSEDDEVTAPAGSGSGALSFGPAVTAALVATVFFI